MAKEEEQKTKYRISGPEEVVLYLFAILFDLLTFIVNIAGLALMVVGGGFVAVGLNIAIGIIGGALMAFFFWLHGVSVFSQKIALRYWGRLVVKIIPIISLLPAFVLSTWTVIDWSHKEDKHKLLRVTEKAVAASAFARSKTKESDAKAVDRNVAAFAKKKARTADKIDDSKRTGDKLRSFGDDVKKLDSKGAITRRNLATSGIGGDGRQRNANTQPPAQPPTSTGSSEPANDNEDEDLADAA